MPVLAAFPAFWGYKMAEKRQMQLSYPRMFYNAFHLKGQTPLISIPGLIHRP